jgi:hypothetical protein
MDEPNLQLDRPLRPGALYLDPERFELPNRQLLRRHGKTAATSKLPELEQNFQYIFNRLPESRVGFGQGLQVRLDPERTMLESTITPWFGKVDSPDFVRRVQEGKAALERAVSAMPAGKARHAREFTRELSSISHLFRTIDTSGLGATLRVGVGAPNVSVAAPDVQSVHSFLAYLLGRSLPPESASMDMGTTKGMRATRRHAVSLGLQLDRKSSFPLGAPEAEHVRALELAFGTAKQGNLLASMGLRTPRDLPGVFFQEQVIGRDRPLNEFTRALVEKAAANKQRVAQSAAQLQKLTAEGGKFTEASVAYRNALEDFLMDVFNPTQTSGLEPGLIRKQFDMDKSLVQSVVDDAFSSSFRQKMTPFGKEHLNATKRYLKMDLLEAVSKYPDGPAKEHVVERLKDIDRGLEEHLLRWVKTQTTFKPARTESKATVALAGGRKAVRNPATKVMSEAIPAAEMNVKRIEEGTAKLMKTLGRTAPKIPMFLVAALTAGLVANGVLGGSNGEA